MACCKLSTDRSRDSLQRLYQPGDFGSLRFALDSDRKLTSTSKHPSLRLEGLEVDVVIGLTFRESPSSLCRLLEGGILKNGSMGSQKTWSAQDFGIEKLVGGDEVAFEKELAGGAGVRRSLAAACDLLDQF